jgi:raffinose/stachyose/melibiose transport system permease protein
MITRAERGMNYGILTFFCFIAVYPILNLCLIALQPDNAQVGSIIPRALTLANFDRAWHTGDFKSGFVSSTLITGTVTVASTILATLTGYAFGTIRFRGSRFLFGVFLLGLVIPTEGIVIPLYYDLRGLGLVDTYWSVILPQVAGSVAFGTFWMRAFFRSLPKSIAEAARVDGASSITILRSVLLPAARPAIQTLMVLLFLWSFTDFLLPLIMLQGQTLQTLPLNVLLFAGKRQTDVTGLAAAAVFLMVPLMLFYVVFQRQFIRGLLSGAVNE